MFLVLRTFNSLDPGLPHQGNTTFSSLVLPFLFPLRAPLHDTETKKTPLTEEEKLQQGPSKETEEEKIKKREGGEKATKSKKREGNKSDSSGKQKRKIGGSLSYFQVQVRVVSWKQKGNGTRERGTPGYPFLM